MDASGEHEWGHPMNRDALSVIIAAIAGIVLIVLYAILDAAQ